MTGFAGVQALRAKMIGRTQSPPAKGYAPITYVISLAADDLKNEPDAKQVIHAVGLWVDDAMVPVTLNESAGNYQRIYLRAQGTIVSVQAPRLRTICGEIAAKAAQEAGLCPCMLFGCLE